MRISRIIAAMAAVALAFSLAGCYNAYYFFSFQKEQALGNDEGEWVITGEGTDSLTDYGLYLNGNEATAPLMFKGDFKVTLNFWLGVTDEKPGSVRIAMASGIFSGSPSDWVRVDMLGLGTEEEGMTITEGHDTEEDELGNLAGLIPGLNRGHWNKLTLEKKGSDVKLMINGRRIAQVSINLYAGEYFTLNFYSESDLEQDPENPTLGFIIKDIRVDYSKGNAEDLASI